VRRPCECCEGIHKLTPARIENLPGLDALAYRAGTHATFLETMKARLSNLLIEVGEEKSPTYPLAALTTRDANDFSIAILDGWATVADVLTFYQERIANEGYLRTATERRSVLELARLVGYALRPGVSSTVYFAYTIEETFKEATLIEAGARAQSVPGPGELPQAFETSEPLEARAQWNNLTPRMTQPQTPKSIEARGGIYLKGINTNLKPNDPLLVRSGTEAVLGRVLEVQTDAPADRTFLKLAGWNDEPSVAPDAVSREAFATEASEVEQYSASVRAVVAHYSDTDARKVNPATKTAGRVLHTLKELEQGLDDELTLEQLAAHINEKLEALKIEQSAANAQNFTVLKLWIGGAVADLEVLLGTFAEHENPRGRGTTGGVFDPAASGQRFDMGRGLGDVMIALTAEPSVPPPHTSQLRRSTEKAFARGSDTGLQFIGAVRPDLREALPNALASLQATPDSEIEIYALRARAATYGSTAPKRSVFDSNGAVVGTREWPINGTLTISVSLELLRTPFRAKLLLKRNEDEFTNSHAINDEEPFEITVGDLPVSFAESSDYQLEKGFVVGFRTLNRTMTFNSVNDSEFMLTLKVGNTVELQSQRVSLGQTLNLFLGGRTIKVTFSDAAKQPTISVVQEIPLPPPPDIVALDATFEQITPGSWVAVVRNTSGDPIVRRVVSAQTVAKNDYNFPAKVTELKLSGNWLTNQDLLLSNIRTTTVYAQSERLELADEPIEKPVCGDDDKGWLELDGFYSDLKSGRWLIVAGERADVKDATGKTLDGVRAAELVMLSDVRQDVISPARFAPKVEPAAATFQPAFNPNGESIKLGVGKRNEEGVAEREEQRGLPGDYVHTFIKLSSKLAYCYKRDKVKIYGNVAKATHGETRKETIGAGDASRPLQSFTLKQPPLTYVAAPNPSGVSSTLRAYVNDIEWHEVDSFIGLTPAARAFVTRTDDEGKTTLTFGNGKEGARLPTGLENVRSVYRSGIGKAGNVRAEQISLLVSRPLGVQEVINPLRASGGADKESRDQARRNAPLAVMALDRLVSVQDYSDFARTFAGIGKAAAARLSDGRRTIVHLTIAGAEDIPIDPTSDLYQNLLRALRDYGSPEMPVRVEPRELLMLVISASVKILPDYLWESVSEKIRRTLLETFSFERRDLGQDVLLSELINVVQSNEGVEYVDVDVLGAVPEKKTDVYGVRRLLTPGEVTAKVQALLQEGTQPQQRVRVHETASVQGGAIRPAQLALLTPDVPDTLILNEIK
jgi:Baseplate J-like protein